MRLIFDIILTAVLVVVLTPVLTVIGTLLGICVGLFVGFCGPIVYVLGMRGIRVKTTMFEKAMAGATASIHDHLKRRPRPEHN